MSSSLFLRLKQPGFINSLDLMGRRVHFQQYKAVQSLASPEERAGLPELPGVEEEVDFVSLRSSPHTHTSPPPPALQQSLLGQALLGQLFLGTDASSQEGAATSPALRFLSGRCFKGMDSTEETAVVHVNGNSNGSVAGERVYPAGLYGGGLVCSLAMRGELEFTERDKTPVTVLS